MNRRALLTGLTCFVASPAIVRASSLMPIKSEPTGNRIITIDYEGDLAIFRVRWKSGAKGTWVVPAKESKETLEHVMQFANPPEHRRKAP